MGYYIDETGAYYEGDKASPEDIDVLQRPDAGHAWVNGEWVPSPAPVPASVSRRQAWAALIKTASMASVKAAIDAMPGTEGDLARNDFYNAQSYERSWPLIQSMQQVLGWTSAQVYDLFRLADTL